LWKHTDWRLGKEGIESRRSTRLVVSFVCTVSNYEYGFFWYFYLDGTMQLEVKMTGLVNTTAIAPGQESRYGTLVAPGLEAQIHQHFFCIRLDMNVDGPMNSVVEVNTQPEDDDENPFGNAFRPVETRFRTEKEAQRKLNPQSDRLWKMCVAC
jgi:primary-amine oxidase